MINQAELSPTINGSGEHSALRDSEERQIGREELTLLLDSMADDYVKFARSSQTEYEYLIGYTDKVFRKNEAGEEVLVSSEEPIYRFDSKETVLKAKLESLQLYTGGAIRSNALPFDTSHVPMNENFTIEQVIEHVVTLHVSESIQRAEKRYEASESTNKFIEVISKGWKNLGSAAIQAIQSAPSLFSHPTNVVSPKPVDDRHLLDDPSHAPEVTVALNLHSVTPAQVRAL